MSKVLVTGGLGYIGSHTVVELLNANFEVVIIDNLVNSSLDVLDNIIKITGKKPAFYELDINDYNAVDFVFKKESISGVIHFASYLLVDESVINPLKYYRNNIIGLLAVLDCVKKHKINHFVFSSSCTVYGSPSQLPVTEHHPITKSVSPYGNTKITGELLLKDYTNSVNSFNALALRYFNPVGAHSSGLIGELSLRGPKHLFPIIYNYIQKGNTLKVFGGDYNTPDGTPVRDYIHVVDLAFAHVKSITKLFNKEINGFDEINIGTGKGYSVLEIIKAFEKELNVTIDKVIEPKREGDAEAIWADNAKAKQKLQWISKRNLSDMVRSSVKWEKSKRI